MQVASQYALSLVPQDDLDEIFEGIQLAVGSKGGPERAVHILQTALECGGDNVCLAAPDIRNAFGTVRRSSILTELYRHDALRPLAKLTRWLLSSPSPLYLQGPDGRILRTFKAGEGVKQGDSLAPLLFALATIDKLKQVKMQCPNTTVAAILDDVGIVGSPADVVHATALLRQLLQADGLQLQPQKTSLLWPHE